MGPKVAYTVKTLLKTLKCLYFLLFKDYISFSKLKKRKKRAVKPRPKYVDSYRNLLNFSNLLSKLLRSAFKKHFLAKNLKNAMCRRRHTPFLGFLAKKWFSKALRNKFEARFGFLSKFWVGMA